MRYIFLIITVTATLQLVAQKDITVANIYHKGTFRQSTVRNINWMKDGGFYSAQRGNNILKYDINSGEVVDTILNGASLRPSIQYSSYSFNNTEDKLLLLTERESIYRRSFTAEYYVYDLKTKELTRLSENGKQSYATFSPDASKVAFARENNIYYVTLDDMQEYAITSDGQFNKIINGSTDWVYEEELSFTRAFEWSGDSEEIIYLTFNESEVREYNLQQWNDGQLYPGDYRFKYPKAGEDNSNITATVYSLGNKEKTPVDIGGDQEYYIARIKRTQDDNTFSLIRLTRLQNQLDILHVNAESGEVKTILTEKSDTYIDIDFVDVLTYLKDGKHFIHASEKSGYKHLYLYNLDGELENQITSGDWEVVSFEGVDQSGRRPVVYYTSTEISPMSRGFYSIRLNGRNKKGLRVEKGVHSINMSSNFNYYIDYYSSAAQPLTVSLYNTAKNELIKVMEKNEELKETAETYALSNKEFIKIPVNDVELNAYLIKPPSFNESKEYPLLVFQYSGPGSQQVLNSWGGGSNYYWHQMLAQKGYIVAVIDPRGTGGRGAAFKKVTYKQLGKYEAKDHIAAAKYLGALPYVNADRIGIWGWSYGGYMSSLAMFLGEGVFKAAIAVAPVTNWRYYDTIYTERYMATPQENAAGYDENSPTSHVNKLQGNYLLVHGTGDDNVHLQNAMALQAALIKAGKQFDSFYYPDRAHGIYRDNARMHLFTMMTDWLQENL